MATTNPAILQLLANMQNNRWINDITRLNEENMNAINDAFISIIENGLNVLSDKCTELEEKAISETDTLIIDGMGVPDELLNDALEPLEEWNGEFEDWTFNS